MTTKDFPSPGLLYYGYIVPFLNAVSVHVPGDISGGIDKQTSRSG